MKSAKGWQMVCGIALTDCLPRCYDSSYGTRLGWSFLVRRKSHVWPVDGHSVCIGPYQPVEKRRFFRWSVGRARISRRDMKNLQYRTLR